MAQCRCCHTRGFMVETDVNGLCEACAPYYYLQMDEEIKTLQLSLQALSRIQYAGAAAARLEIARESLERLRPYEAAKLARLPKPSDEIARDLDELEAQWAD